MERRGVVTRKGEQLTLVGPALAVGDRAPGFTALDKEGGVVRFDDFRGKIKVISVTPSLDTPVCDLQARRFNSEAARLPGDVIVLNLSMDLPAALERFCVAAGIDRVLTLSDHREASFGENYGVLIKELRLLTRAIFIVDRGDRVRYIEIVPEITSHPDYERALHALEEVMKTAKAA